ncbi:hypothetical protein I3760_11G053200 [Carya illinoinensis]|nr:hypothetical protein I3760_14G117400 [Carya illinoinensis]KAG2679515.1 hypothetical protein I3760_11G053200 [Carya illinoinensis]
MMFRPFPKLHCSERNCSVTLPLPDYPIRKFLDRNRLFRFCCQAAMRQRKVMRQKCRITQNTEHRKRTQKKGKERETTMRHKEHKKNKETEHRSEMEPRFKPKAGSVFPKKKKLVAGRRRVRAEMGESRL